MIRKWRMAAWALAVTLAFSGLALADRDDDRDRDRDRKDRKHEKDRKREEKREHDRDRDRDRDRYRGQNYHPYQDGTWRRGDGDNDRDDRGRNGGYGYPNRTPGGLYSNGSNVARQFGYQDGVRVATEDRNNRKPYQPYPRGNFGGRDHGYHSGYGDKGAYREEYARAFEQGYQSTWGGGRGRWGR